MFCTFYGIFWPKYVQPMANLSVTNQKLKNENQSKQNVNTQHIVTLWQIKCQANLVDVELQSFGK